MLNIRNNTTLSIYHPKISISEGDATFSHGIDNHLKLTN